jgi:hypothetical protein
MTNIDYSAAIERGVSNWLDANKHHVLEVIRKTIEDNVGSAVDLMATGVMTSVGRFLDNNGDDLKAGIAMAIATSWAARQHPVPGAQSVIASDGEEAQ